MIFHLHGQCFPRRVKAGTLRHRPTDKHAIHFQAKVIVQTGGIVPLNTKEPAAAAGLTSGLSRLWFRRLIEVPFARVFV
jgi:hypothetical protein